MRGGPRPLLVLVGVVIVVSVSSASIFVKLTVSPPSLVSFWRLAITLAILGLFYTLRDPGVWREVVGLGQRVLALELVSGVFLALHFYTWIWSLRLAPVYIGTTLVDLYPLFAAILAVFFLREYPTTRVLVGIATGVAGIFLLGLSTPQDTGSVAGPQVLLASLVAVLGGLFAGVYVVIGRYVRTRIPSLALYVMPTYTGSLLTLLVVLLIEGRSPLEIEPVEVPWLFMLAVGPMIGGHTLLNYILRFVKASVASLLVILEPVGASLLAYMIFGEKIPPVGVVGMLLAVSGVVIASTSSSR